MKMCKTRIFALGVAFLVNVSVARADSLYDALMQTYNTNPSIEIARKDLETAKSNVKLAEAGFFPSLSAGASINYTDGKMRTQSGAHYTRTEALQFEVDQNLFTGFQTINSVKAAIASEKAQEYKLQNEEQNQLNNAVSAYVNVYATREIVALRKTNLQALKEQLRSTKAKLDVGEGTITDYAQAKAEYSRAISDYSEALATNSQAEAAYQQIVGSKPGLLIKPTICNIIPSNLDEAMSLAMQDHPAILAANYLVNSASYSLSVKDGSFAPKLDVSVSSGYQRVGSKSLFSDLSRKDMVNTIGLKLSVPICLGGSRFAQRDIARHQLDQAKLQLDVCRNNVRSALTTAWAKLQSSKSSVQAYIDSVKAAEIALDGRVSEYRVGQATFLDILNTRSQLISMQVALINAKRELVVASYNIEAALGRMTASYIQDNRNYYVPKAVTKHVKHINRYNIKR